MALRWNSVEHLLSFEVLLKLIEMFLYCLCRNVAKLFIHACALWQGVSKAITVVHCNHKHDRLHCVTSLVTLQVYHGRAATNWKSVCERSRRMYWCLPQRNEKHSSWRSALRDSRPAWRHIWEHRRDLPVSQMVSNRRLLDIVCDRLIDYCLLTR